MLATSWLGVRLPRGRRLGLTVTACELGVLAVRGRDIIECREQIPLGPDDNLGSAVQHILRRALMHIPAAWSRSTPTVWVALDLPSSQVKTIRGLPLVEDARILAQILAATPERFFLGHPQRIVTAGARVIAPGVAESVAFDATTLDEIQRACTALGLRVACFAPASVALLHTPKEGQHLQGDMLFDAAYGVTQVAQREPLAVRPRVHMPASGAPYRRQLFVAAIVACASIVMAILAPPLLAIRTTRMARQTIATLAPARATALATEREVATITAEIGIVQAFERHRISKTLLLAQLTQALPAGAAVTALTADTTGTTVVVLAPKAADVVQGIEEILGVSHVELLGPVTREASSANPAIGGSISKSALPTELERVTVRFQLAADGTTARRPLRGTDTQ